MITLQGKGVSGGIAEGTVYFLRRRQEADVCRRLEDTDAERDRLARAQRTAIEQLEKLAEKCRMDANDESAALLETHALFVEDDDYAACIHGLLEEEKCNAEYAVYQAGERFAAMFEAMDDPYLRARAADIRDVSGRILNILTGTPGDSIDSDLPVILAADELAPSEVVQLDRKKILGFITGKGSDVSHAAILARSMGIPAVFGLEENLKTEFSGRTAWVDGETGRVFFDPDEASLAVLRKKQAEQRAAQVLAEAVRGREDVSADGRRLDIYCNIGSVEDISAVLANDGRGIGLFRSEFLYLAADDYPDEEKQFQAYKSIAAAMNDRRVVIRTLDVGADKQADYLQLNREENPALGMRGIRLCLNRPEVFRVQLRALYRASAYGKLAIMFPMIVSLWEVRECKRICREVMAELDEAGIIYDKDTELGVMIETPAAVFIADALAAEVDFFSVGTNDLSQYFLACDRQAGGLERFYDPHHPALLHALKLVADAAHGAGIWVGICGELAADPELLPLFLAIGIDELSVSPTAVLPLREKLRRTAASDSMLKGFGS